MDETLLKKLLRKQQEEDWLEFKEKFKLYQADGKLAEKQRDEFIKDVLGLANGNSHIVRKTKYLIIGADNQNFEVDGERKLHNVDYRTPSQSEIATWLKDACSPRVVGLECELVEYRGRQLFILTIPPTFDLHEATRDLITPNGNFHKHTVFMRQDEHTLPASVRDGITIEQLKHLHRQEIANPPAVWIGIITGGVTAYFLAGATYKLAESTLSSNQTIVQIVFVFTGIIFGCLTGILARQFNETRYDLRYMTWKQRVLFISLLSILLISVYLLFW